jgi:hypothetical protein
VGRGPPGAVDGGDVAHHHALRGSAAEAQVPLSLSFSLSLSLSPCMWGRERWCKPRADVEGELGARPRA